MGETIRVFVGTDTRQAPAERALETSIRKHTRGPVDITWMRAGGDDPRFRGWKGQPDRPLVSGLWATTFTCFRYAVPELAGFAGRAIYLDSDMLVLADLRELWEWRLKRPWHTVSFKRTDVSVIDCAAFKDAEWWPRMEEMRRSSRTGYKYRELLRQHGAIWTDIPQEWDSLDRYEPGRTKCIHFTLMPTQPWKPWPESMQYRGHRDARAVKLWQEYASTPSSRPAPSSPAEP